MKPISLSLLIVLAAMFPGVVRGDAAEEAWRGLLNSVDRKSPAFAFPEYDPKLPSVLIYGDSISMGYQPYVREGLAGRANVYRLHTNGSHSGAVVRLLEKLQSTMAPFESEQRWPSKWDVIHINVGLHDLKYVKDGEMVANGGTQVHTAAEYEKHLREDFDYLRKTFPDAKIIFATTTPVPEGSQGRKADDAARYNEVAIQVLNDYPDIVINDLHSFTAPHQSKWWTKPGNVHYNRTGQRAQGEEVTRAILKELDPPAK
ncbi:SGNH/GDSL hydrolase family protein [Aeoliella sp. SH292]|uniref:SGNH/GDSL hydrolase family protein n=1 Tax=Aeoliella sp. SH292 TaxID=3454464 RepID=UPI003F9916DA